MVLCSFGSRGGRYGRQCVCVGALLAHAAMLDVPQLRANDEERHPRILSALGRAKRVVVVGQTENGAAKEMNFNSNDGKL